MLAIQALEDYGLKQEHGPVLVTGAAGGVGSVEAILANIGYEVQMTGRPKQIILRIWCILVERGEITRQLKAFRSNMGWMR